MSRVWRKTRQSLCTPEMVSGVRTHLVEEMTVKLYVVQGVTDFASDVSYEVMAQSAKEAYEEFTKIYGNSWWAERLETLSVKPKGDG